MIATVDDLLKSAELRVLQGCVLCNDEVMVRCFFDEIARQEKRHVKKRSNNHYSDYLWYINYEGRLARVVNTNKNPLGKKLIKSGRIYKDNFGLLRSDEEIEEGTCPKTRPLLEELDKGNYWSRDVKERIASYLDGGKPCTMVIDQDFATAYEPDYHENFCLEGDLVTGTSCMSEQGDAAQSFYGGIENCYVCRFENEDGEQVGRCIMYEFNGIRHFIRIYAYREYARCALRLLRAEMKEGDLFGRAEAIPDMELKVNWDFDTTPTMYLDGEHYGWSVKEGVIRENDYDFGLGSTANESLSEYLDSHGWASCRYCGEWHHKSDMIEVNGDYYCDSSCAESDGCIKCAHCGEFMHDDFGYELPDGQRVCCSHCLRAEGYTVCWKCGKIIPMSSALNIQGEVFCDEACARESGYEKCAICGDWHRNMYKTNRTHRPICIDCASKKHYVLTWSRKPRNKRS